MIQFYLPSVLIAITFILEVAVGFTVLSLIDLSQPLGYITSSRLKEKSYKSFCYGPFLHLYYCCHTFHFCVCHEFYKTVTIFALSGPLSFKII